MIPIRVAAAAAVLALVACGGEEPAPEPGALKTRMGAPEQVEQDVEKSMDESQARMEAEMRAAAGEPADSAARP